MDMERFDPVENFDYLILLGLITRAFPTVESHQELVATLGASKLTDVSDLPAFRQMDALSPLPPGYTQRIYQFRDRSLGRGTIEVAFHGPLLVNARVQLFVQGWFAQGKARRFLVEKLIPSLEKLFGAAVQVTSHHSVFRHGNLFVMAWAVPGTPSVSTHLTHENYV